MIKLSSPMDLNGGYVKLIEENCILSAFLSKQGTSGTEYLKCPQICIYLTYYQFPLPLTWKISNMGTTGFSYALTMSFEKCSLQYSIRFPRLCCFSALLALSNAHYLKTMTASNSVRCCSKSRVVCTARIASFRSETFVSC